uniref:DUF3265 domain-containing protein n=1 Tax=Macrostomum lignano TaxID=282301 RepID=A0A1I8IGR1_9PLAT
MPNRCCDSRACDWHCAVLYGDRSQLRL